MHTSTEIESEVNEPEQAHRPGELYKETFDQILSGLLAGLKKHDGKLDEVTLDDIIEGGNLDPLMMEQYFSSSKVIMNEVISTMKGLIEQVPSLASPTEPDSMLTVLLTALSLQPCMVEVLMAAEYHIFWENNLKPIATQLFADKITPEDELWADLYSIFCHEFECVVKKWSLEKYAEDRIPEMVRLLSAWIGADKVFLAHARA